MIDRLAQAVKMWKHPVKQKKENTNSSSAQEEVKSFMLIRTPMPAQSLPIDDYLNGRKDSDMQNVGLLDSRYPIYDSLDVLLKANKGKEPTFERSCYVLSLKYSKDEAYALIRQGEFHKAIASAKSFEEASKVVSPNKGLAR